MGSLHSASYLRAKERYPDLALTPRLVVVADPVEERARAAAELFGFESWTTDAAEAIEHPDVEAASLTTPNDSHLPLGLALAAAGKHVWGEKPLGRYPEETARIAQALAEADVRSTVGYNYRHAPMVAFARELIEAGEIGEVRTYRGVFLVDYAANPNRALSWRFSKQVSGLGVLGDLMSHVVDMAQSLAGPVESVSALGETQIPRRPKGEPGQSDQFNLVDGGELGPVENEDYVSSLASFANGASGSFEVSRVNVGHPVGMAFEVRGTKGALAWSFERMNELKLYYGEPGESGSGFRTILAGPTHGDFVRFQPNQGNAMSYDDLKTIEAATFIRSIAEGRDLSPHAGDALATAKVLEAMRRSFSSLRWETVGSIDAE
jgi:predicted dehydrogenase